MQIDWWTFIAQIINLVILLFLLRKFLYIPVLKAVEARQKVIADELAQAAEERNKAKALSLEFARKNKQTERQKQKILAAAQVEAEKLSVKLCAEAEAEYQKQRMEWQQKLIKEQKTFVTAVQNLLAKHFTQFAESALRQMANVDLNKLVITHFMDKVKKMPAAQKAMLKQTLTESDMVEIHSAQPLDEAIAHDLEHFLRVEHQLLALPDAKLTDIEAAASHPQALAQCSEFLKKHQIKALSRIDTAKSCERIVEMQDKTRAAIASKLAAKIYGLNILASNIENESNNTTRFLIMGKEKQMPKDDGSKFITSLVFKVKNIPAALYKTLGGFATNGVNITKLESYVIGGNFVSAQFYIEIEAHPESRDFKLAFEELKFYSESIHFLGTYKAHPRRYL